MAYNRTMLQAIDEVVEVMQLPPYDSNTLPSAQTTPDTTSNYGRAEVILERVNQRVQSWGWPQNFRAGEQFTSSGLGIISLANHPTLLSVKPSGKDAHRHITIAPDTLDGNQLKLYDANRGTFNLSLEGAASTTIFLDTVRLIPFESLDVLVQNLVIAYARKEYLIAFGPSQAALQQVADEIARAELAVRRLNPVYGNQPPNIQPSFAIGRQQEQG